MSRKTRKSRPQEQKQHPVKTGRKTLLNYLLAFAFGAVIATTVTMVAMPKDSAPSRQPIAKSGIQYSQPPPGATIDPSLIDPETMTVRKWRKVASLDELLKLTPEELEKVDIAEMNLLCATGLPGAEKLDISKILMSLDAFAASVRYQTNRHLYRVNDPKYAEHYKHSENVLRAEFLVQVLQEDCGIHYNLQRVRDLDFTNSKDLFIHGLIGSNGGTCSSMPVLYVAVARRLGYPMSLALAPGHVLARWDAPAGSKDPMKHFNVEGSGYGFSPYDDEHYRDWPRKMTKAEAESGYYLRPLSGAEMLSVFLTTRGHCLLDIGLRRGQTGLRISPTTVGERPIPRLFHPPGRFPYRRETVRQGESGRDHPARRFSKASISAARSSCRTAPHRGHQRV